MEVQFLKDWSGLIATILAIGSVLYAWLTSGSKSNSAELEKVDGRLDAVETRLTQIEADMKHLPDDKAFMELKLDLADMKGTFGRMEESITGITRTVHRVEEYLLKKGAS